MASVWLNILSLVFGREVVIGMPLVVELISAVSSEGVLELVALVIVEVV